MGVGFPYYFTLQSHHNCISLYQAYLILLLKFRLRKIQNSSKKFKPFSSGSSGWTPHLDFLWKNKASFKPSQFMSAIYQHVVFSPGSRYHSLLPLCEHRREIKLHTLRVYALRHNDRQTDEGITGKTAESSVPITLADKPSVSQFTANFLIFPNRRWKENRTYLSTACWSSRDVSFA